MGNNKQGKRFVDYWTFKNAYDQLVASIKNLIPALSINGQNLTIVGGNTVTLPSGIPSTPKVYKAILTQSGTNSPVVTVLNSSDANYLGNLTWNRLDVGQYGASKTGVTVANTLFHVTSNYGATSTDIITLEIAAAFDTLFIGTHSPSGAYKDGITQMFVTIEYYGN